MISVIIPTYNEADNMRLIIPELSNLFLRENMKCEIIVVDDNSPDGTAGIVAELGERYPVRVHVRRGDRGLSRAVIKGFELAEGDICVVMDADLSHPIEEIPAMVRPIMEDKCDATVGSRYIPGGGSESWGLLRKIISRGAGFLAKGVSSLTDPTSGFMAVRKSIIEGVSLDPLGWKIVLEVVVKAKPKVLEIPIIFADRRRGESKLGLRAQIDYIHHLWRLYAFKHPAISQFFRFCLVGLSGFLVDTAVLVTLVDMLSLDPRFAAVFAFSVAVTWNYIFNRRWSFEFGKYTRVSHSYVSFVSICLIGLGVRIGVMHLLIEFAGMGESPWYILASFAGIGAAMVINFIGSKYIAFGRFHKKA